MIRVGPAGWSYPDWEGRVYPRPAPRGFRRLRFLARFVDCIEINTTFYALPDPRAVAGWARQVEGRPGFRFTAKLHQDFTHGRDGGLDGAFAGRARGFLDALAPLRQAGLLGALLAQFPVTFQRGPEASERLRRLRDGFGELPLVLEVRHASWFGAEGLAEVAGMGWSLAHIDLPEARDHPPSWHEPTGRLGYLRLHGRNRATWFDPRAGRDARYDYLYAPDEVRTLAQRARRLAGQRDETYVVTNNHFAGKAVANALELKALLRGETVAAPAELLRAYPQLAAHARSEGQGRLF